MVLVRTKKLLFQRWYDMKDRCNNPNSIKFKNYGARGVSYQESWNDFDNYLKDVISLEGWDESKFLHTDLKLDKDTKILGSKIYSCETCRWITNNENMQVKPSYQKSRYAYNWKTDKLYLFFNTHQFATIHGLKPQSISSAANRCDNLMVTNPHFIHEYALWNSYNKKVKDLYIYKAENIVTHEIFESPHQKRVADFIGADPSTMYRLKIGKRRSNTIYKNRKTQEEFITSIRYIDLCERMQQEVVKQKINYDSQGKTLTVIETVE